MMVAPLVSARPCASTTDAVKVAADGGRKANRARPAASAMPPPATGHTGPETPPRGPFACNRSPHPSADQFRRCIMGGAAQGIADKRRIGRQRLAIAAGFDMTLGFLRRRVLQFAIQPALGAQGFVTAHGRSFPATW